MKTIKEVGIFLIEFALFFILSAFLVYSILHCIQLFVPITSEVVICIMLGACTLLASISVIYVVIRSSRMKESRMSFWINNNTPNFAISYAMICLVIVSITNEVKWSAEEIKETVTVEWTIFGLSLTIFLVWNVIIDYLRRKQPVAAENPNFVQKYNYLKNKQSFLRELEATFSTIVLLTVNLFLLISSTGIVYLGHSTELIIKQNVVQCSFYFTTNTIIMLFLEMLKPLRLEKKELKKANAVSNEELNKARSLAFSQEVFDECLKMILASDKYTNEQKKEMGQLYIKSLKEALENNSGTNQENDDLLESGNESVEDENEQ